MSRTSQAAVPAIRFTDREAIRLITGEAAKTGEPLAKVTARCVIRYFAKNEGNFLVPGAAAVPTQPHSPNPVIKA